MASRQGVFSSSVGTKILIGFTGILLVFYLLIHIGGNLVVFLGPAAYNKYAFTLESSPLLILIELVLLSWFVVHIYKTVRMYLGNQSARPIAYARKKSAGHTTRKTFASSTMIFSGLWLFVFLLIHVKTFRDGWGTQYEWPAGGRDLYRQEMEAFQNPLMVAFYVISMLVVTCGVSSVPRWGRQAGVDAFICRWRCKCYRVVSSPSPSGHPESSATRTRCRPIALRNGTYKFEMCW
jgi:succinate dehydrogenase / fumarate reductase cytochrome b subunit